MLTFASSFLPTTTTTTKKASYSFPITSGRRRRRHRRHSFLPNININITNMELKPERVSELSEEDAADLAELASIDRLAAEWIGSSIPRWVWYERIKSRRHRLRVHVKNQEREATSQIDQLRTVLLTLDALLEFGLVENNDRISIFGWMLVLAVSFANFVLAFVVFELFSNVFVNAFNLPPF